MSCAPSLPWAQTQPVTANMLQVKAGSQRHWSSSLLSKEWALGLVSPFTTLFSMRGGFRKIDLLLALNKLILSAATPAAFKKKESEGILYQKMECFLSH